MEVDSDCESIHPKWKLHNKIETLNLAEMNPPEGQGQGEPGAQGLRLIIQACQRLYPQQPNPLQVQGGLTGPSEKSFLKFWTGPTKSEFFFKKFTEDSTLPNKKVKV